ncbi:hypothetical protein F5Y16DRAFT_367513 [Xylariaceae sp. FL0255]|nr:hypothetical protein F5Y16DRAFT_367513 [Xylariaceae sp. FL0255]
MMTSPYGAHHPSPLTVLAIQPNPRYIASHLTSDDVRYEAFTIAMPDDRTHPLLAQVPLTVSPFVTLPTAATLPYTYKTMPSTLPPPSSGITADTSTSKTKYIVSRSGQSAHPDDIIASCRDLQQLITKMQADAECHLRELHDRISARDLAEKRRVAPGWLDSDARLLEPERQSTSHSDGGAAAAAAAQFAEMSIAEREGASEMAVDQGEELDRAFGAWR